MTPPGIRVEFELALTFARLTNRGGVQVWMRWGGWSTHVGCDRCVGDGRAAACWSLAGCHRYASGCGCDVCALQQLDDERMERAFELAALAGLLDLPGVVPLRDELAAVGAQIDQSDHRRAG